MTGHRAAGSAPSATAMALDLAARVDCYLAELARGLDLTREDNFQVLDEIRASLLDAAEAHMARGKRADASVELAVTEIGSARQLAAGFTHVYDGRDTREALLVAGLPVVCALALRWLAFEAGGSSINWSPLLRPGPFLAAAGLLLVLPAVPFGRVKLAMAAWTALWGISVAFVVLG